MVGNDAQIVTDERNATPMKYHNEQMLVTKLFPFFVKKKYASYTSG